MTEQVRREQIAFPNQNRYHREPRPAQHIPTGEQIIAAARRQAAYEAADESYSGHQAGIHPEHRPFMSEELTHSRAGQRSTQTRIPATFDAEGEYELEEDDSYYNTRLPTSTRRYQVSPEEVYQSGNTRYHVRYVDVPKRKGRQPQLPPARERHTEGVDVPIAKGKRHIHPLLYLGVGMLAMAAIFLLLSNFLTWFQIKQDDLTYGRPRTFQIDAVVGHNDSVSNPSHFLAINLNRHIEVIEIPGQDASRERVFQITTLFGDGQDITPVTLSFRDVNGDHKPDMLIHIQDTVIAMINDNGTFRPTKPGEVKGIV